jgi:membrane-associated phospholipid phosphatase
MVSRVSVGAHWLSDVGAGAVLTWGCAMLLWGRFSEAASGNGSDDLDAGILQIER